MKAVLKMGAVVLLAFTAGANAEERFRLSFEKAEKLYTSGECVYSADDAGIPHRDMVLLFLEDVLRAVTGRDSYASDMIGDMSVFKIGRKVDSELMRLYDYAKRSDVHKQIKEDTEAMSEQIKSLVEKGSLSKEGYLFFVCEEYKMISGKEYYFANDLNEYSKDLNRRIYTRNINNLQDLLRDVN
ncbi:hypothetical protein [Azotobacter chroococcum]|uniref:hypothetical protein n=1 Tax=Azotobacter chroococcum TaxID=353 RepID=UPI0011854D0D|nr:hypothetical protein [Azotobacter chroococcum]